MKSPAPILHLTTTRPTAKLVVEIDGVAYPLLAVDRLSIHAYRRLAEAGQRLDVLWTTPVLTAAEAAELIALFDEICRLLLIAPPEVHAKLTDLQRVKIYEAFLALPTSLTPAPAPKKTRPRQ